MGYVPPELVSTGALTSEAAKKLYHCCFFVCFDFCHLLPCYLKSYLTSFDYDPHYACISFTFRREKFVEGKGPREYTEGKVKEREGEK